MGPLSYESKPDPSIPRIEVSHKAFARARNQSVMRGLLTYLRGESDSLLPFEEVRQKLRLSSANYLGLRDVPFDRIVGSVDRYQDFTRAFLPRWEHMRERWAVVDQISATRQLPPVELYKVGDAYFVRDGHHRVSVARQGGRRTVKAHVWEYVARVPLEPETKLEGLLLKAEYVEFLEHTHLDEAHPDLDIDFTAVGGYRELEWHIAAYQQVLSQIDERPFSYPEAAALWYDMIYTPVLQLICEQEALRDFPGRTEADLLVWILRHLEELGAVYGAPAPINTLVARLVKHNRANRLRRFFHTLRLRRAGGGRRRRTSCPR